jgi:type I restriction-modification system DNA methylase subunit
MKTLAQQRIDAAKFSARWKGKGDEKQECHKFWLDFLENVLGVINPLSKVEFEKEVETIKKTTNYIDVYVPSCKLLIEQKSSKVTDLEKVYTDQVLQNYIIYMRTQEMPRYVIVCNFKSFLIYDRDVDMRSPRTVVKLSDLAEQIHQFSFIVDPSADIPLHEEQISVRAGKLIQELYNHFAKEKDDVTPHELNIFCTRLLFCFFAEDAGIFPHKKQFYNFIKKGGFGKVGNAIADVFYVLNTPYSERTNYLTKDLQEFPYVNGGLFAQQKGEEIIPDCGYDVYDAMINLDYSFFDWSTINPTIFGAIFESTLNPKTRKANGMHYTSIENIHKVIDPLFLNDLNAEYEAIIQSKVSATKRKKDLAAFQNKLASLTFLDPACGSGNFLTETYMCLRRLENKVIKELYSIDQAFLGDIVTPIKVSINQFYGIEKEDFAVTVAKTALWIAEFQMRQETAAIIRLSDDFLPLHTHGNIVEGNALRMNWEEVVPNVSYIIGNPPFVGTRSEERKPEHNEDLQYVFGKKWKGCGYLDYVCGWFKKAFDYMRQSNQTKTALVATKSIKQGRSPRILFTPMLRDNAMSIDFAWETFVWSNDADNMARVHCVIVGFSCGNPAMHKYIYDGDNRTEVDYISAYLKPGINVDVAQRKTPLCASVPQTKSGIQFTDAGAYLFTDEQKAKFLEKEPAAAAYFKLWQDGQDLLHNTHRWCLWLCDCTPAQIKSMPLCYERMLKVRKTRAGSRDKNTQKQAETPTKPLCGDTCFDTILAMPVVSSGNRDYIPIAFIQNTVCARQLQFFVNADVYAFGILNSAAHMAWLLNVCGYKDKSFRYSPTVYNTFPWPTVSKAQQEAIEKTAQAILDARALYPDSTLADLYDPNAMPIELRKAHEANDKAVLRAYGFPTTLKGDELFRELYKLYQQYVAAEEQAKKK